MIFSLWTHYGALNSKPVFEAFANSLLNNGHSVLYNNDTADVNVIWSVLFNGRMAGNKAVWEQHKPTIVLEVGGIQRGTTWKVGLNGINRDGDYFSTGNNNDRARLLGLELKPWRTDGEYILIAGQHDKSLQWQNMPSMSNWFLDTYDTIRQHTDRPIIFRPHPRCRLEHIERGLRNVIRHEPQHINGTYDDFDMVFDNVHCTISYSSNPGIHSIINGVPAFVGPSSLAYPVANDINHLEDIEELHTGARQQWLNDYAWTEFTVEEISQGLPLSLLTSALI
jgi:hypothetical protein|tara:strand:+ start:68076 stop:68918 length:843 start_codon:yes stop_codon:yes gene_type:complete